MADLPTIDFASYLAVGSTPEEKKATALQIDNACRNSGFFYLKNHGVPKDLLDGIRNAARTFFEAATPEQKALIALKRTSEQGDNARGHQRVDDAETGSHEAIDFFRPVDDSSKPPYSTGQGVNQWPSHPVDFRQIAESYIEHMERLGNSVVEAIALALGVDASLFLSRIDKAFWNLRVLGYEGRKSLASAKAGIGEHTDFGILTFLLTDDTTHSLQVLSKTGEWIYADPVEGCFLCNIGDMLAEWTRGVYRSTKHRVVHTSDSLRISVPFFFDPNWDAYIEPVLPAIKGEANEEFKGIRYRDKFVHAVENPLYGKPEVPVTVRV